MIEVATKETRDRGCGAELDVRTAVVFACQTGFALAAGDGGFDCDAVADGEVGDRGVGGDDYAGGFVAEDVVASDDHCGADAACVPEVDI